MGRGSSKAGGGSSSGGNAVPLDNRTAQEMTDAELDALDDVFMTRIDQVKKELADIAKSNPAYNMPDNYYDTKRQQQILEKNHKVVIDEKVKRKKAKSTQETGGEKTFVNSYGEATKRNITTAGYERQRKKLSRDIMKYVGGK